MTYMYFLMLASKVHVCNFLIATFILRTYPSREDVQGAYRSGYIKIGIHNYAFDNNIKCIRY